MTYRAKPVVRPRRQLWESPERRNMLLNIGFGLVVLLAVVLLIVAAGVTWYNDHLAPVASVNGQAITRDEFNRRAEVEQVRLQLAESRILDEFNAGRITQQQRDAQLQFLDQRSQSLGSVTLERLIDARVQGDLAAQRGISITDQDVEQQLSDEATRPEQRHVWVIAVEPEAEDGAEEPTPAAEAEARAEAEAAHEALESGTSWEDVAAEYSTDTSAATGGDLGWVAEDFGFDDAFEEAVWTLEANAWTDVIEGDDGTYRIGRVTEIVPEAADANYLEAIANRGVAEDVYRAAVRDDLVGERLREEIEAEALAEGPQRRVQEIFLENQALPAETSPEAVKTRHILYSPKDDPEGAAELPDDDQAWKDAEDEAREAFADLSEDISGFDARAREDSDEQSATITGGKLPWFDPSQLQSAGGGLDDAFGGAIFADGLEPGQLLEPVKSGFGWHVIQVMYFPTDQEQAAKLKAEIENGADFADLARDFSYAGEAEDGGDLGWVARYQLSPESEEAVFAAEVGTVTEPVIVDGEGIHLFLVAEEQVRAPEGEQRETIEQSAFSNWYAAQKETFTIERSVETGTTG